MKTWTLIVRINQIATNDIEAFKQDLIDRIGMPNVRTTTAEAWLVDEAEKPLPPFGAPTPSYAGNRGHLNPHRNRRCSTDS